MKSPCFRRAAFAALASLAVLASGSAHAIFRTYLSSNGNDANPCTLAAPCRLLPAALAAVDAGGEVWMLDSANFNTGVVGVTKSVTILAVPGQLGSLVGMNGTALSINGAGIEVTLQNLNILSFNGTGDIGVLVSNAGKVTVSNCNIFGFKGPNSDGLAIWVNPGANSPKLTVINSVLRNNHHGIVVAGNGRATISRTHIVGGSGVGVWANAGTAAGLVQVHVSDSVSSGNAHGFVSSGATNGFTSLMFVTRSVATENAGSGFLSQGGITAYMAVGESMATNNAVGFNNQGGSGAFASRSDNMLSGNANNTIGTITFLPPA